MAYHNLEELLQPRPSALNHVIAESVREHLAGQRRYGDARTLALQNVTEVLEVGVPAAHGALPQLEGGDVGPADDLVVGVHGAADAVRSGIADLVCGGQGQRLACVSGYVYVFQCERVRAWQDQVAKSHGIS